MNEVLSCKTMEVKFSVSGPIGGAKSGINLIQMTQKRCLQRWYKAVSPY
jgi:hypothetical protein